MWEKIDEIDIYKDLDSAMITLDSFSSYTDRNYFVKITKGYYSMARQMIISDKKRYAGEDVQVERVENADSITNYIRLSFGKDMVIRIQGYNIIKDLSNFRGEEADFIMDILKNAFIDDIAGLY